MGVGKYSPILPNRDEDFDFYRFNCYGEEPTPWSQEIADSGVQFDVKTMYGNYDPEGFDSYGYTAFDEDGNYVGSGSGVDRAGYTEDDYLMDSINGGDLWGRIGFGDVLKEFKRKR